MVGLENSTETVMGLTVESCTAHAVMVPQKSALYVAWWQAQLMEALQIATLPQCVTDFSTAVHTGLLQPRHEGQLCTVDYLQNFITKMYTSKSIMLLYSVDGIPLEWFIDPLNISINDEKNFEERDKYW